MTRYLSHRLAVPLVLLLIALHGQLAQADSRVSAFVYHPDTGLLVREIVEPDHSDLCLVTEYTYDDYGNKTGSTTRNCNGSNISGSKNEAAAPTGDAVFTARGNTTSYAATTANAVPGQFPGSETNALTQSEYRDYDARFGKVSKLTGPNSLPTTWEYDGFGRKVKETRADGTTTIWTYAACDASCPVRAKYSVKTQTSGAPDSISYLDQLNREVRSATIGFDGRWVYKDTEYDRAGRVARSSRPYYAGATVIHWSTPYYDDLGRVTEVREPGPNNTTLVSRTEYAGLTTKVINANNQTKTTLKNSQGQVVSVTDALGKITTYQYDPFGNLTETKDPKGNRIVNTYDTRGRKLTMSDPDMGNWTYAYNALGELIRRTDAKAQTTTLKYDKLGRQTQRSEPDLVSNWYYDKHKDGSACYKGIGKLCDVTANNNSSKRHDYDDYGRIYLITTRIDVDYTSYRTYDAHGRPASQTVNNVFVTNNVYNAQGHLAEVRRVDTNALLWRADKIDAEGHITQETYGNNVVTTRGYEAETGRLKTLQAGTGNAVQNLSYVYDSIGNLTSRSDGVTGGAGTESFGYDALNRLTTRNGATYVSYDELGNITWKSDVGNYSYPAAGQPRPHAVTQAGSTAYGYDANGNMASRAGRSITWTSYNLPYQLTETSGTTTFLYDGDHVRIKQTTATKSVIYLNPRIDLGGHYDKETENGVTKHEFYFYAGGRPIGVYITDANYNALETRYFHADHLGSVSVVTNASGAVIARYAFDPWGKRSYLSGSNADASHHGFTGHEMLDDGLIHMNGRVYDPVLGRFLSADPTIEAPEYSQSYNRYSYIMNNPLAYADPSGYCFMGCFWHGKNLRKILKPVVAIAVGILVPQYAFWSLASTTSYSIATLNIISGAAGGFLSGAVLGGNLKSALIGGLTGGAFGFVGNELPSGLGNIAGHAAVGCVRASLSGGSCGTGALSQAASSAWTNFGHDFQDVSANLVATTVVGGTTEVLGGGKFANGATTAAFGYLFNHCAHNGCWTTAEERAYLNRGDFRGYYTEACRGGDLNACRFYGIATGEEPGPSAVLRKALLANGYSFAETNTLVQSTIPLNLANDYANLLPQSEAAAAFPSAQAITRYHWTEFGKYGLPPSTFGGTPFGNSLDRLVPSGLWCSLCTK